MQSATSRKTGKATSFRQPLHGPPAADNCRAQLPTGVLQAFRRSSPGKHNRRYPRGEPPARTPKPRRPTSRVLVGAAGLPAARRLNGGLLPRPRARGGGLLRALLRGLYLGAERLFLHLPAPTDLLCTNAHAYPPRARQMNVATRCQASGREYSQWAIPESNSARRSSTKHPEAWISRFGCIAPGAAGWYTSAAFRAVPTARQGAFCAPRPQTMAGASRSG